MKRVGKSIDYIRAYLNLIFAADLHAERVDSLAHGVLDKHAIEQVDRFLSNKGIEPWTLFDPKIHPTG